ncbi:MAG: glycine zipper domain-containing protein [Pseudomonadota bacterium]
MKQMLKDILVVTALATVLSAVPVFIAYEEADAGPVSRNALRGAAAGALAGGIVRGGRGAAVGAAVGAATGAAIGKARKDRRRHYYNRRSYRRHGYGCRRC